MSKPLKVAAWSVLALVVFLALIVVLALLLGTPEDDPGTVALEEGLFDRQETVTPQATIEQTEEPVTIPATPSPIATVTPTPSPIVTSTSEPTPRSTRVPTLDCVEPERDELAALLRELQSCKPDLSPPTKEAIGLYLELQEFRYDPEFHLVGFGVCCQFNLWKDKVDALGDGSGLETMREVGIVPGELFSLGWEYFMNQGNGTFLTAFIEANMKEAAINTMGLVKPQPTPTADASLGVEIIGEWENEYVGGLQSSIKIISQSGAFVLEETFQDGSTLTGSLVEVQSEMGRRFDDAEGSGGYFVIDSARNLQIWSSGGLISTARKMEMDDFVLSDSGIKVWKTPDVHPLLHDTDTMHPSFLDKLSETYSRGKVKGLPRILSENSEDARTWHYFSPLLSDDSKRTQVLQQLLVEAFPETVSIPLLEAIPDAELDFWPKLPPPPSRPQREGASEPDILIRLGDRALVLVEAKYRSDISERTTYDENRDQVIRLIDVGSWHAGQDNSGEQGSSYANSFVIVLQYGDADTNAEEMVDRYKGNPEAIEKALAYRSDLTNDDVLRLSNAVEFVRWPDPVGR